MIFAHQLWVSHSVYILVMVNGYPVNGDPEIGAWTCEKWYLTYEILILFMMIFRAGQVRKLSIKSSKVIYCNW